MAGILAVALLVGFDQLTKHLASTYLQDGPFVLWDGVFELHYSINRGAAFGILQEQRWLFVLVTVVIVLLVLYIYSRIPMVKKYLPLHILCVTVLAGALGNFIDRISAGFVVDFLYFKLINFPVFNVSDCYITCSCVAFILLIFFYYGDGDFAFLSLKKKQEADSPEKTEGES